MYYQVEQVLEKQEPEIEKFYKGRGILICESKQNLFALKEYTGSLQKAEFLYWLGICLEQQGIRCDAMLKNKEGAAHRRCGSCFLYISPLDARAGM